MVSLGSGGGASLGMTTLCTRMRIGTTYGACITKPPPLFSLAVRKACVKAGEGLGARLITDCICTGATCPLFITFFISLDNRDVILCHRRDAKSPSKRTPTLWAIFQPASSQTQHILAFWKYQLGPAHGHDTGVWYRMIACTFTMIRTPKQPPIP